MGINLVTYAAQTVTPQDDALIYEKALQESGMIYGGTVTIKNANVLHVAEGHGALCGRKFTIEETDVTVPLTASGSLLGRLYIHMDLADSGEPISFQVQTANSLTPVVQQSDVNINNGVYEINIATFTVDTSTISNLVNVAPFISIAPDSGFSAQSNNPVMNKVITKALGDPEIIGGSASKAYTKGALLLATDGQIYEVTANIALHGSIVDGGNVTPTGNIISQISNFANYAIGVPNYSDVLSTITTKNASYTATKNCWLIGWISHLQGENIGGHVYVDNVDVATDYNSGNIATTSPVTLPIKKGSVITTSSKGYYDLKVFGTYL